jgi:hypothetical protein
MKRICKSIFIILFVISFYAFLPTQAQAHDLWNDSDPNWRNEAWEKSKVTEDGYRYVENSKEVGIIAVDIYSMSGNELHIPESINGKPVVAFWVLGDLDNNFEHIFIPKYMVDFTLELLGSESRVPISYEVAEGNTNLKVVDGVLYSMDGKELIACPQKTGTVRIPSGVVKINSYAFTYNNVTKVIMPDTVKIISKKAFNESQLQKISLSKNLNEIGEMAFYKAPLKKITLPSKLKKIGAYAFCETHIKTIKIPKNVTSIGKSAFEECPKLEKATFASGSKLKVIEQGVFRDCYYLEKVTLPTKLKKIGSKAFYRCMNLRTIKIPATVTKIADDAFVSKGKRRSLTIKAKKNSYAYRYAKNRKNRRIKAVAL